MEVLKYVVNMEHIDDIYHLRPLGDIHYGNPACDTHSFIKHLTKIRDDPFYLTIGMGDYVENNNAENERSRKTHDPEMFLHSDNPLLSQQIRMFREMWRPIVPKTIGMHYGNHEDRTILPDMFKLVFCESLGVRYLGSMAYTLLQFKHNGNVVNSFKILSFHSRFGGQKPGSVSNSASNKLAGYIYDVALFGHTHFAFTEKDAMLDIEDNPEGERPRLLRKRKYVGNTGSFLFSHIEGVDTYPDKTAGAIRDPGTITISFDAYNQSISEHA